MIAPNVDNLSVGKGEIWFDKLDSNGDPTGEMHLGNMPNFTITPEIEDLPHYSSMESVKKKDKVAAVSTGFTMKGTFEEPNTDNLNLAFYGDGVTAESQSSGSVADASYTARSDRYIKFTHRKVSNVVVTNVGGGTTYVVTTDYTVDEETGRLFCLSTGDISDGQLLEVDYDYTEAAYEKVQGGTDTVIEGLLRFKGTGSYGPKYEVVAWKVRVSSGGDIPFISEEWLNYELSFEVLDDSVNHAASPYFDIINLDEDALAES